MKPAEFIELLELSNDKLAQYKTAAAADASKADKAGDFKKGNKRFSGIVKATNKQFANDAKSSVSENILAELDTFAPRTVYFKMADGNYIKADYRGSEGFTGKANDNVTFTAMSWVPPNTARTLGLDKFLAKGSESEVVSDRQYAQSIVGTSNPGEGPLGNRTIDVVDFVNGKKDTVPSALKTQVMQWVQKNTPQQQVAETFGLNYPGTYEQTNDMFKGSGQRRIGTLTTEDEQIDGMAQGEIREIIKNAIHIKNQLDKGISLDGWMYSYVTTSNDHLNSVAEQINNPNIDEEKVRLDPKCWTGKHKEGTKMKGGVRVNNCVPNESAIFKGIKG